MSCIWIYTDIDTSQPDSHRVPQQSRLLLIFCCVSNLSWAQHVLCFDSEDGWSQWSRQWPKDTCQHVLLPRPQEPLCLFLSQAWVSRCIRAPQDHLQLWLTRRTNRTQKGCYTHCYFIIVKGQRLQSAKVKQTWSWVQDKPCASFRRWVICFLSEELHSDRLSYPSHVCNGACQVLPTREAHPSLGARVFIWSLSLGM